MSIYALNLFNVKNSEEYNLYYEKAGKYVKKHGGTLIALGKLESSPVGDIEPREVMMLVQWESKQGIANYINDPEVATIHPHREKGVGDFVWHLFESASDFRAVLDKI